MRINPVQQPVIYKGKINTGVLTIVGLFIGSLAGARAITKRKEK